MLTKRNCISSAVTPLPTYLFVFPPAFLRLFLLRAFLFSVFQSTDFSSFLLLGLPRIFLVIFLVMSSFLFSLLFTSLLFRFVLLFSSLSSFYMASRWLAVRFDMLSFCIMLSIGLLAVLLRDTIDPALTSLAARLFASTQWLSASDSSAKRRDGKLPHRVCRFGVLCLLSSLSLCLFACVSVDMCMNSPISNLPSHHSLLVLLGPFNSSLSSCACLFFFPFGCCSC